MATLLIGMGRFLSNTIINIKFKIMNKKFSTLVAALLASGGLFYAVDAMILPAGDGVAQKYVMVETRAGAVAEDYSVILATGVEFAVATKWTATLGGSSVYTLKTAAGSILYGGVAVDGVTPVLLAKAAEQKAGLLFTADAEGRLKVGDGFLIMTADGLVLKATPGAGESYVCAYSAAETYAKTNLSATSYALAAYTETLAVWDDTNKYMNVTVGAATFGGAAASSDFNSGKAIEIEKDGEDFFIKLGKDLYLSVVDATISSVSKADRGDAAKVTVETNGAVKVGGVALYFANADKALTTTASENWVAYIASETYASDMSSEIYKGGTPLAVNASTYLFGASNLTSMGSSSAVLDYAAPVFTSAAQGTEGTFGNINNKISYNPTTNTLRVGSLYLGVSSVAADGTLTGAVLSGDIAATQQFTLDTDGAIKCGDFYVVFDSGYKLKAAADATKANKLYLYSDADVVVTEAPTEETAYVIGDAKYKSADFTTTTQYVSATEQDAVEATPGAEIPGMENVNVDADGTITPGNATSIVAPVEIRLDGTNYLSIGKDNKVIKVAAADVSVNASWILKDSKYMSVAMDRAGVDKKYLKYAPVSRAAAETPAEGFTLVAEKDASKATFNGVVISLGGVSLSGSSMSVSTKAIPEAPATSGGQALVAEVGSGFYLLSAKDGAFVSESGVTAVTNDAMALWKVEKSTLANGVVNYSFYHMNGETKTYLNLEGTVFTANNNIAYNKGVILKTEAGNYVNIDQDGKLKADPAQGAIIGLYEVGENKFAANELTVKRGHSFDVIIAVSDADDASTDIEGNPFTGVLTPVDASYKEATSGNNFYLKNAAGEYIVLDLGATWGGKTENLLNGDNQWNRGYKFTTVSEATFKADVVGHADKYKYVFSVSHSAGVAAKDSKEALIDVYTGTIGSAGSVFGRLYVAELLNNKEVSYVLTTTNGFVDATKEHYPYVIFGSTNMAKQTDLAKGKFITVSKKTDIAHKLDGFTQVLTVVTDVKNQTTAAFVDVADAVADTLPAAQWAVKVAGTNGITLYNREFPAVTYTQFNNGLYTIEDKANDFAVASALTDTVRIKFHDIVTPYDGYANFDEIDVRDNLFRIGLISPVFGETAYLSENHGTDHQLGFVKDEEEATEWTLAKMTDGRHMEKVTKTDTIYVVSTSSIWKDSKWQTKDDTLKITPFYFINSKNDEAVIWGKDAENINPSGVNKYPEAYICNPKTGKLTTTAQAFVLKKNGKGFNLIAVNYDGEAKLNNYTWNTLTKMSSDPDTYLESLNKIYAGVSSDKGITNRDYSYCKTENDIFSITPVSAEMYRKVAMGDTIKIFREDNEADVLFEKGYKEGNFLARVNDVQFPKTAPAMYVDTAYVDRGKNNRWEYLLVVNPERKIVNDDCGVPSHEKFHADTTYGRFLVNLIDSANIYNQSQQLHNNKYVNSEGYAKLAFVPGYHTHDTLYLDCVKHVVDTISLDRQVNAYGVEKAPRSVAKFAFRIIDQATKSFVIETQYKQFAETTEAPAYEGALGYLKWMNDYVVVVPNIKDADVFNMTEEYEGAPTANEDVTVSSISVIAKEGAVTINGAAGKTVTISNVLGQTIASEVLSSDNATISAPAGVVVVAVEGEAAVKAIVK